MNAKNPDDILTPLEVAEELSVRPAVVRTWLRVGTLPCSRLGPRTQRITRRDLVAFMEKYRVGRSVQDAA